VYLGYAGAEGLAAAGSAPAAGARGELALKLVGLLATAVVTVYVTRIALRAVRSATAEGEAGR
jgi:hypothetical protein